MMSLPNIVYAIFFFQFICEGAYVESDYGRHVTITDFPLVQNTRKSLKNMRKWQKAHKAEVSLITCLSKYFASKVPVDGERNDIMDYDFEYPDYTVFVPVIQGHDKRDIANISTTMSEPTFQVINSERKRSLDWATGILTNQSISDSNSVTVNPQMKTLIDPLSGVWQGASLLWSVLLNYINFFRNQVYRSIIKPIWNHKLVSCPRDYFMEKFWAWVDAAPD